MAMDFRETTLTFDTPARMISERIGRVTFDGPVIRATCILGDFAFGFSNGDNEIQHSLFRLEEMLIDGNKVSFRYRFELADRDGPDDPIQGKLRIVVLAEVA